MTCAKRCLGMSISDLSKQGRTASIPMSLKQTEELWMCIPELRAAQCMLRCHRVALTPEFPDRESLTAAF